MWYNFHILKMEKLWHRRQQLLCLRHQLAEEPFTPMSPDNPVQCSSLCNWLPLLRPETQQASVSWAAPQSSHVALGDLFLLFPPQCPSGKIGLITYASWGHGELALEEAVLVVFLAECLFHNWFPTLKSLLFHLGTWDLSGHTEMRSVFSGWEESAMQRVSAAQTHVILQETHVELNPASVCSCSEETLLLPHS